MSDITLSLILPTYNEEENLKILLPRLAELFKEEIVELVIVDDGSSDETVAVARKFTHHNNIPLELVLRKGKQGIGSAIRAGYNAGHGKILFSMDADCAFSDQDIVVAWKQFNVQQLDLLVGQRTGTSYRVNSTRTLLKKLFSIAGNWLVSRMVGLKEINDYSLNFRIIKKELWQKIADRPYHSRNFFLFQMIDEACRVAPHINQIPVHFLDRMHGKSKMSVLKDPFIFFYNFIKWKLRA